MASNDRPLTAQSPIREWLNHPEGGQLIRQVPGHGGAFDETALEPVLGLPLQQLVALSQGQLPQELVDDLVLRANGGIKPEEADVDGQWRERITTDRFTGRTVVVTGAASGIGRATASRIAREGGRVNGGDVAAAVARWSVRRGPAVGRCMDMGGCHAAGVRGHGAAECFELSDVAAFFCFPGRCVG
ncbi:hypothetical protein ACFRAU_07790 [Arthrobacter sp. NPDC056691]|uniref:hypothetical protein n=1 Tax=Arthrobacter sp. NPDC056691 TaxID=3345913 RepID=UPI00366DF756